MLRKEDLKEYQKKILDKLRVMPCAALFIDMGYGKTILMLSHLDELIRAEKIKKVLVITNLRIANGVWKQEALKWEHTRDLKIGIATGNQIEKEQAMENEHDILVTNKDFVAKMFKNYNIKDYDCLVIDESTAFKNSGSLRFVELKKKIKNFNYVYLMSGSAYSNDLIGLWSQMYLLDSGERLGLKKTDYLIKYFYRILKSTGSRNVTYMEYIIKEGSEYKIKEKIKDLIIILKDKDIMGSEPSLKSEYNYDFPYRVDKIYKSIRDKGLIEEDTLKDGSEDVMILPSAWSRINKLLQVCNGAYYKERKEVVELHDSKVKLLKELVESSNDNFLVFTKYKFDYELIKKQITYAKEFTDGLIDLWNEKKIKVLVLHPKSCGHGLNLQYGGSTIVWFSLTYSLEEYEQANARLQRPGQENVVKIMHLIKKNSVEERVLRNLKKKMDMKAMFDDLLRNG